MCAFRGGAKGSETCAKGGGATRAGLDSAASVSVQRSMGPVSA